MANGVDPDQTVPIGAVYSGSTLFASLLNSSVMLGNYLQQTTFSDAFFSWRLTGKSSCCGDSLASILVLSEYTGLVLLVVLKKWG